MSVGPQPEVEDFSSKGKSMCKGPEVGNCRCKTEKPSVPEVQGVKEEWAQDRHSKVPGSDSKCNEKN